MQRVVGRHIIVQELDFASGAALGQDRQTCCDEAEARLLREMRAIYALHDLYHRMLSQPVPQHLIDLVASYEPGQEQGG